MKNTFGKLYIKDANGELLLDWYDNCSSWASNQRMYISFMNSSGIGTISDINYSLKEDYDGSKMDFALQVKENKNELYEIMQKKQSRIAITSGGNSPVLDDGGNNRSIFSEELEKALEITQDAIDSASLFAMINKNVTKRSIKLGVKQIPQRAIIPNSNHEGGDFVLIAK